MRNHTDWELLSNYLAGWLDPTEREAFERRLAADPVLAQDLASARRICEDTGTIRGLDAPGDPDAAWTQLSARVAAREPAHRQSRTPPRWSVWRVAAAVVMVTGASIAGFAVLRSPSGSVQPAEPIVQTFSTIRGQRLALRLPDSTKVVLAPASTLRLASTYGNRNRTVELVGQAAFTVIHDEYRPFVVRAGNLVAEDLGTEFVVRAYPDDPQAQVVVREGIVAIGGVTVRPGQMGWLSPGGDPVVKSADTSSAFAWTDGRLVFERTPLREAVPQIERWYDVTIQLVSPGLGDQELTTALRESSSASHILSVLASVFHVDVIETGPRKYALRSR